MKIKCFFYDNDKKMLTLGFVNAEFVLKVNTKEVIEIDENCELYECLNNLFAQDYDFGENYLNDIKNEYKFVWHSDCYYNSDDEWSIKGVSCLNIVLDNKKYKLWCDKQIDKLLDKTSNSFCICFSPCGNGRYSKNIKT